ncbi:hypothetical protein [Bradyrhizobium murdochi]|uniref:hypothetical protein n=1 Tax=Bradyrhizobium murdochi TaxID=1038859 RepID=UPI0018DCC4D6|nr:hypothetical protein [Bradyrhizobium murdochi]
MTVFVYINTSKQVGDPEHIKVFANVDAAENGSRRTTLRASPLSMKCSNEKRPPEAALLLRKYHWPDNQAEGRNPSGVPAFHRGPANRAFKAADLSARGHGFGAVINRAALARPMM